SFDHPHMPVARNRPGHAATPPRRPRPSEMIVGVTGHVVGYFEHEGLEVIALGLKRLPGGFCRFERGIHASDGGTTLTVVLEQPVESRHDNPRSTSSASQPPTSAAITGTSINRSMFHAGSSTA